MVCDNKAVVTAWLEALNRNDTESVLSCYSDDITITTMGNTLISGCYGAEQVQAFVRGVLDVFPSGLTMTVQSMTAEDDRVSVEATGVGTHVSGAHYEQHYHFLVTLADGKITSLKEYLDTELITDVICGGRRRTPIV